MNTRIRLLALAALLSLAPAAHSADNGASGPVPGYLQGKWVIAGSLGVGLANTYGGNGTPLIAITAEQGVTPRISVGGSAGVASSKYSYLDYTAKYTYTVVAARGSYHFTQVAPQKPLDLYAGLSLGYNHVGVSETGPYAFGYAVGDSYLLYGLYGGARWYVNPKAAVFGELGYGLGSLAVGASLRL